MKNQQQNFNQHDKSNYAATPSKADLNSIYTPQISSYETTNSFHYSQSCFPNTLNSALTETKHHEPKEIATLPAITATESSIPLSKKTGKPKRITPAVITIYLYLIATIISLFNYALHWWQAANVKNFSSSAHIIASLSPKIGSWQSLVIVSVLAVLFGLTIALLCASAYQIWRGIRFSRITGIAALISITTLMYLLQTTMLLGWIGVILTIVAEIILWHPTTTQYFNWWQQFNAPSQNNTYPPENIYYGRLPRFR